MKYSIDQIDKYTGQVTVTFIDDNGNSSQMVLAGQMGGVAFTLSDAKQVDTQLLASRDNWITQNGSKQAKTIDPALQQYIKADAVQGV